MAANIGFATVSVIPSFKGIDVRARAGLGVITRIGKDVGEDTGKQLAKGIERKTTPDLKGAGRKAGDEFAKAAELAAPPDLRPQGDKAGKGFASGIGDSIDGLAKGGLAAAGLAAAAVLGQAFLEGLEQEVATDRLAAQLGGSEWAKGLGEVAGNLYTSGFGESVAETAEAVKLIIQTSLLPEDANNAQIEELATTALTFSDVLSQDLKGSIRAVSTLLRTGLSSNAEEAFDLLTRGVQQGADLGDDLLDTFNEYPTTFRELGISGPEAMGLIIQSLRAGARNSDFVADSLKEFGIRGQDASELSARGFELIGLNAKEMTRKIAAGGGEANEALGQVLTNLRNMEDPVKRNEAAVALFGTKAEDLGDALFNMDLPTATQQLGNQAGATDNLGTAYDNAKSKLDVWWRENKQKVVVFIADEVLPRLDQFVGGLKGVTQGFIDAAVLGVARFVEALESIPGVDAIIDPLLNALGVGAYKPGSNPMIDDIIGGGVSNNSRTWTRRRAGGGPVDEGMAYWVGDRFGVNSPSAELFVPGESGRIVPSQNLGMAPMGGNGMALDLTLGFDASAADRSIVSALARALRIRPNTDLGKAA